MKHALLPLIALTALTPSSPAERGLGGEPERPNIVLIYTDDVGYGDVGCYGAKAVKTPNVDRLAREGLRFTDAHAASATCTPSRYALLTGEYAWRKPGTGVLPGNAAMILEPGRTTLASTLQKAGYTTGIVGKWHLGLGGQGGPSWNEKISPGPEAVGFNYHFLMAATGDRVPCVYIEDGGIVGLLKTDPLQVRYTKENYDGELDGIKDRASLKMDWSVGHNQAVINGIGRIGYMKGGKSARWVDEDMADVFTQKAVRFIEQNQKKPFFLSFNTHDIHVPRVPHKRFVGKTTMGPRGDAIAEMDASVGEILKALDRLKLAKNTLVLFTSDNGPVLDDGYKDGAVEKLGTHKPAGPWRGGKYSLFEGGTRVPLIARWPGKIKPGVSEALVCQVDFLASFAALTGQTYDTATATDSQNVLPALVGASTVGRTELVEHAGTLTLREGNWKFIKQGRQLYDLATDPGETKNLATEQPERLSAMAQRLELIRIKAPSFYTQFISASGYPIVASAKVNPYALKEAAYLVNLMLAQRPDVRTAMVESGSRMCILAYNEFTTDQPDFAWLKPKDFWDRRARGLGGSETDPLCSSAEENLLGYPGDPYQAECILIHEFAHNIHLRGMVRVDKTFDSRVKATYDKAMAAGLWKGKYAATNHHEYFAEGVQSWFDNNRENDHDHNHVNTRVELIEYDPGLAALCREVFGTTELKYTKPATRLTGHLAGYDPSKAPTFVWPERLKNIR